MLKVAQLLLVFLALFLPAVDTDLGWHLRYGEYFIQTGQFLRENTLTYFLADYYWPNPFPLYQPLTYLIYKTGGLLGLAVAYGFLGALGFWIFNKINLKLPKINLILFLGLVLFSWTVFSLGWRAQIFTFLGLVLLFFTLKRVEKSGRILWALPLLFLIWANLHGGFVLGLTVLATSWLFPAAIFSALAALVNPNGIELYEEVLKHAQYPLNTLIAEWVAPNIETQILIVGITIVTLFSFITSHNTKRWFWLACILLFAALALQARRNLAFFGLVTALAILEVFQQKLVALEQSTKFAKLWPALLGSGIIVLLLFQAPRTVAVSTNLAEWCNAREIKQPCRAVEYIGAHPIAGQNVFAAYEWGGFLEWQLPQYKYFVDGRMPAWVTPSPYTNYLEIIQARPSWEEKLNSYGTNWLLIGTGTFLDLELQKKTHARWLEQYRDNVAVIYTQ